MTLDFYNVSSDPRTINKKLGEVVARRENAYAKEPLDFLTPVFILTGVNANSGFNKHNYLYCKELGRYYFIKNYINVYGDKTEVVCEEDALMTYSESIQKTDVIVFNQGSQALADGLIADGRLPMQVNTESRTFAFTSGEFQRVNAGNYSFVLNVFGGGEYT